MLTTITNNPDWAFVFSLVGFVLGIVALIMSGLQNVLAWAVISISFAGVLVWWI